MHRSYYKNSKKYRCSNTRTQFLSFTRRCPSSYQCGCEFGFVPIDSFGIYLCSTDWRSLEGSALKPCSWHLALLFACLLFLPTMLTEATLFEFVFDGRPMKFRTETRRGFYFYVTLHYALLVNWSYFQARVSHHLKLRKSCRFLSCSWKLIQIGCFSPLYSCYQASF